METKVKKSSDVKSFQESDTHLIVNIKNLRGCYKGSFGTVRACDNLTLQVKKGEIVGIAGESGSGKSTLVKLLTGVPSSLLHYESGEVNVGGYNVYQIDKEVLRREVLCKVIGYVPQASMNSLNPVKKIKNFIVDVMYERNIGKKRVEMSKTEILKQAIDHFQTVGLDAKVLDLYPHELSGGMKQRTVIAISTLWNPSLLIADEPTSALDVSTQKLLIEMFKTLKQNGLTETILLISHDIPTLHQICDRCIIMYAGKIVEDAKMDTIINNPLHPYTQGLVQSIVSFNPDGSAESLLKSLTGKPPDLKKPPSGCNFHPRCPHCMPICIKKEPPAFYSKGTRHLVNCWLYQKEEKK